jgi:hypothetical protein
MSALRPTLVNSKDGSPAPDTFDSYYMIRDAVERRRGLIAGRLEDRVGGVCAIGAFFADNPKLALHSPIIDEVAAYNDSLRRMTPYQRRVRVLRWLTAKLAVLGWKPKAKRKRTPTKLKVVA